MSAGSRSAWLLLCAWLAAAGSAPAYPLDGYPETGIRRLEAFRRILAGEASGNLRVPAGARLNSTEIRLNLADHLHLDDARLLRPDAALQSGLEELFARKDPSYRVAVLDLTDPEEPRFAAIRADQGYIPGSVAKLFVMASLFDQVARRHPEDVELRRSFLRREVVADAFVGSDHHRVPIVDADFEVSATRPAQIGDRFSLWEWVDHMVSPSSNSAASMVWKEAMLMEHWGDRYPAPQPEVESFLRDTPSRTRSELASRVIRNPIESAGLSFERLRVQTLFTRAASRVIPGGPSFATPMELLRWLIRLEQGRLVDRWSSLEMKKLMYFTRPRYRYASSPELAGAAVYFKSGSLFQCEEEPGYRCGAYLGNKTNLMHSVAIVESPARGENRVVYLVAMMSNVLRVNSAVQHQEIAGEIERLLRGQRLE